MHAAVLLFGVAALFVGALARQNPDQILAEDDSEGPTHSTALLECAMRFRPVVYLAKGEVYRPDDIETYLGTCAMWQSNQCVNSTDGVSSAAEDDWFSDDSASSPVACTMELSARVYNSAGCATSQDRVVSEVVTAESLTEQWLQSNCTEDNDTGEGGCYLRCLECTETNACNGMGFDRPEAHGALVGVLDSVPFYVDVYNDSSIEDDGITINYWFFYAFNGDTAKWGTHQADWENTKLNVDGSCTRLLGVSTSAHGDSSEWSNWTELGENTEDGHIVLYSAINTHATYSTEGAQQHRDHTSRGNRWFPQALVLQQDMADTFSYPGRWGTAHQYDSVLPDWAAFNDTGYDASDLCPQGPTGPDRGE